MTDLFKQAYTPDSTEEFPTSEKMDDNFQSARLELAREHTLAKLIAHMQALTAELQEVEHL